MHKTTTQMRNSVGVPLLQKATRCRESDNSGCMRCAFRHVPTHAGYRPPCSDGGTRGCLGCCRWRGRGERRDAASPCGGAREDSLNLQDVVEQRPLCPDAGQARRRQLSGGRVRERGPFDAELKALLWVWNAGRWPVKVRFVAKEGRQVPALGGAGLHCAPTLDGLGVLRLHPAVHLHGQRRGAPCRPGARRGGERDSPDGGQGGYGVVDEAPLRLRVQDAGR